MGTVSQLACSFEGWKQLGRGAQVILCTYNALFVLLQMLSMVIEMDNITRTIELVKRPNGTREFPARSCCELQEQYPGIPSGKKL